MECSVLTVTGHLFQGVSNHSLYNIVTSRLPHPSVELSYGRNFETSIITWRKATNTNSHRILTCKCLPCSNLWGGGCITIINCSILLWNSLFSDIYWGSITNFNFYMFLLNSLSYDISFLLGGSVPILHLPHFCGTLCSLTFMGVL